MEWACQVSSLCYVTDMHLPRGCLKWAKHGSTYIFVYIAYDHSQLATYKVLVTSSPSHKPFRLFQVATY